MFRRRHRDTDLEHDIQAHLDLLTAEHERRGLSPQAAREAAKREFGGVDQMRERYRDQRGLRWLDDVVRDVRYAARSLRRTPGFAAVAILTLALGIGATTAIFSVVNAVLLRPLPYRDADRLGAIVENVPATETDDGEPDRRTINLSVRELIDLRSRSRTLTDAGIVTLSFMSVSGGNGAMRMEGLRVSPAIIQMLGVQPFVGRVFDQRDEASGAEPAIILSYPTWQQYFGARRDVIGETVLLDDVFGQQMTPEQAAARVHTIVGVMPESFDSEQAQFWVALPLTARERPPRGGMRVKLVPGISAQAAADEVGAIVIAMQGSQQPSAGASRGPRRFEFVGAQTSSVASVRPALLALLVAVGFVVLIACANVANLLLARTAARQRELGIRVALGAGRWRVIRQLVTESVLLAGIGGVGGVVLAWAGITLLRSLGTTMARMDLGIQLPFPRLREIDLDVSVLACALTVSIVTGVACGLVPAWRHSRGGRIERARSRTRNVLVVAQVAMAMTLLVGGGLMIRSFALLSSVELGFDPINVVTFQVGLPPQRYPLQSPQLEAFAENLVARLRSIPGVDGAMYARQLPFIALEESSSFRRTPEPPARFGPGSVDTRLVSYDYFAVMGIPVVAGRAFRPSDGPAQPRVLLINEALARQEFPSGDAVGQLVYVGRDTTPWEIAGIVKDVRQGSQEEAPRTQMFADIRQWPEANGLSFTFLGPYYALRTERGPGALAGEIRAAARSLEPDAGLFGVALMEDIVANRVSRPRMYAVLLAIFSGLAVLLAAIGLHGVMSYAVAQQTRDIGVRMALGAQRSQVMGMVLRHSLMLAAAGIAIGLVAAAGLTRYLEGLLFAVTPLDVATFAGMTALFVTIAAIAAFIPARQAMKVDPVIALRTE